MAQEPYGGPTAPNITTQVLLDQFWRDVYGKEVQTAATYSYTWMADQMGHVCLGILVNFGVTLGVARAMGLFGIGNWDSDIAGLVIGALAVSLWELSAYRSSLKEATGRFPLDRVTLRNNAIVAAAYMIIGVVVGFTFHLPARYGGAWFILMLFVAILCAPPWLRQKIIWQKAALPYLFRLADAQRTISKEAADALQALIEAGAPPAAKPRQVVISGPIGSGRTPLAGGIGTEFAFRKCKVRYMSFDSLLEFVVAQDPDKAPPFGDDPGPTNLGYWPWYDVQVLIIDDIGPLIGAQHERSVFDQFQTLLARELKPVADLLAQRHTVWIIGDLDLGQTSVSSQLQQYADAIRDFCRGEQNPLVIELEMQRTDGRLEGVAKVRSGY